MALSTPGASTSFPAGQKRQQFSPYWGVYASAVTLPNASGNALAAANFRLEAGDQAYVTGVGFYTCTSPGTAGGSDAVWTLIPSGGGGGTDNHIVRWDGTSAFQDGVAIETDAGEIQVGSGLVGTPSLTFVAEPTLGFWRSAAGTLAMALGGASYWYWNSTGYFANQNSLILGSAVTNGNLRLGGQATTGAAPPIIIYNQQTFTGGLATSQVALRINADVNQTSTADFTAQRINLFGAGGAGAPTFGGGGGFFFDCQTNGTTQFSVTSTGSVRASTGYFFTTATTMGFYNFGNTQTRWTLGGTDYVVFSTSGFTMLQGTGMSAGTANQGTYIYGNVSSTAAIGVDHGNLNAFQGASTTAQVGNRMVAGVNQSASASFTALQISMGLLTTGVGGAPVFGGGGGFFLDLQTNGTSVSKWTAAGRIQAGDGTIALPSLTYLSEPTTGWSRPSAGQMSLSNGGTQSVVWTAAGQFVKNGYVISTNGVGANEIYGLSGGFTTAAEGPVYVYNNAQFSASTGVSQKGFRIYSDVNQTGAASFTSLYVNQSLTTGTTGSPVFGSGGGWLADFSSGGATKFSVSSDGGVAKTAISPAVMAATENDYAGAARAGFTRLTPNALNTVVTGLSATNIRDGHRLTVINIGNKTLTFNHQDAGSAAANRIITSTGAAIVLTQDQTVEFMYDLTTARWRQIALIA
jgi:hypothetical protein